ncbi:MAG: class I SAM-dependent methyltransferase [Planctomycetaceae bacterium]
MLNTENRSSDKPKRKKRFRKLVERKSTSSKERVTEHYDGPAGAFLSVASKVSLHEPLVGQLLKSKKFDVSRFKNILDIGAGAGQILGHLLKLGHPDARLVGIDLSPEMLRRARSRLKSTRPAYITADMTRLPFADESFDCITCGWVIEHLPDPAPGLSEFERVLQPGGSILMLVTEDNLAGAFTSRTWHCRTINRKEFEEACGEAGLGWKNEFWFTPLHKFFKFGGIVVEAIKNEVPTEQP